MSATNAIQELVAGWRRESEERMRAHAEQQAAIRAASLDGMTAMERALSKIEPAARRIAINYAKSFARQFKRAPQKLNSLAWNLSQAEPADGIRAIRRLGREHGDTHMLVGAMVYFRWARRHERAVDRGFLLAAE